MKHHTARWVEKAEEDIDSARTLAVRVRPPRNAVCFHCQQAVEKYLKALLQELGAAVPKTHNLKDLLGMLRPLGVKLATPSRSIMALTKYAVEYRYPGESAYDPPDAGRAAGDGARPRRHSRSPGVAPMIAIKRPIALVTRLCLVTSWS